MRERKVGFSVVNIVFRPLVRFIWAYFFRMGFLDGREGLVVLMNHAAYVSWKYTKAWQKAKIQGVTSGFLECVFDPPATGVALLVNDLALM